MPKDMPRLSMVVGVAAGVVEEVVVCIEVGVVEEVVVCIEVGVVGDGERVVPASSSSLNRRSSLLIVVWVE